MFAKTIGVIDAISEWSGKIISWVVCILLAVVVFEVVSRNLFSVPHVWVPEICGYLYGFHFMMLAAYTLLHRGHVNVDIFYSRFSPKTQAILDLITYTVFFIPFIAVLFYWGFKFSHASFQIGESSPTAALPIVPYVKSIIPVMAGMSLLQVISFYYKTVSFIFSGKDI